MSAEFTLGKWKVLPSDNCIVYGEETVKIEPKAMALLLVLVKADGEIVSRSEIFEQVWKNQIVADHVLYNVIANLRKALQDDHNSRPYISTVPKKGYRLLLKAQYHNTVVPEAEIDATLRKGMPLAIVINLFLLVMIVGGAWLQFYDTNDSLLLDAELDSATTHPLSIAVLPFDVFSNDINTQYFADGLAEEIIHQLTVVPNFNVIARTSSFSFRGEQMDMKTIGDKLQVEYLIEGSVRQEKEQLRITVHLIKAKDSAHVWSKVFARQRYEVLSLQQDISISVVNSLLPDYEIESSGLLRQHPLSEAAYMHYLHGRAMSAKATPEYFKKATLEYQQAIELEPKYALAHVALALDTLLLMQYRHIETEKALKQAQFSIDVALEVSPNMAEAYAAQGLLFTYTNKYKLAESAYKKALSLDPFLSIAHHNYGFSLWMQDYHPEALEHFQRSLIHNPMSAITNFAVADTLFNVGQLQEAERQYAHCTTLLPDYPACQLGYANFYRFTAQQSLSKEHLAIAKQYLQFDNIYLVSANIVDTFWSGDFKNAWSELKKEARLNSNGYLDLQLQTLVHKQNKLEKEWTNVLLEKYQASPQSKPIQLALGLSSYLNQQCPQALSYYEPLLLDNPFLYGKFNVMVWGISHLSNMAYCYEQLEQPDKMQEVLTLLNLQIQAFKIDDYTVPGVEFVKLKVKRLENQTFLTQTPIQLDAPVIQWLSTVDPAFK